MDAIEKFKVDDKVVKIFVDEDPENPRTECDNCDLFILFHPNYNLGDKHDYKYDDFNGWDEMEDQIIKDHNPVEIRQIRMYEHSGITISDSSAYPYNDRWDSSMIGFALISRKSALETMMVKRITKRIKKWAKECLDSTIKTYDQYLRGECYGYVIEDVDGEELESCWGFIGMDCVKEEATEIAKGITIPPKPQPVDPNQLLFSFA